MGQQGVIPVSPQNPICIYTPPHQTYPGSFLLHCSLPGLLLHYLALVVLNSLTQDLPHSGHLGQQGGCLSSG